MQVGISRIWRLLLAAWGPKCGVEVSGRIWGCSHQMTRATQITSFKQMLSPSRKGATAKQSVLLFSGSHCGYCPDPFLIWSRIHSGIPFITALDQIKLFPPAHTNWLSYVVVPTHIKLILWNSFWWSYVTGTSIAKILYNQPGALHLPQADISLWNCNIAVCLAVPSAIRERQHFPHRFSTPWIYYNDLCGFYILSFSNFMWWNFTKGETSLV